VAVAGAPITETGGMGVVKSLEPPIGKPDTISRYCVNTVSRPRARGLSLAMTRKGTACQSPAVKGKKRCGMHGGANLGAPPIAMLGSMGDIRYNSRVDDHALNTTNVDDHALNTTNVDNDMITGATINR
jgi:hypothetical protein